MRTYKIYTITNPETGLVFYVGCTSDTLKRRLASHKSCNRNGVIEEIETVVGKSEAFEAETFWIHQFKAWGFNLSNKTKSIGYKPTKNTRLFYTLNEKYKAA